VRAVRQALQYDIDGEEVVRQLDSAATVGVLLRVENNGVISYKEAAKQPNAVVMTSPSSSSAVMATTATKAGGSGSISSRTSDEPPAKKV